MAKVVVTLDNKVGLHARPAGAMVRVAKEFQSAVTLTYRDKQANAKSILSVLSIGAEKGAIVTIEATGDDAEQAVEKLRQLVRDKFGEPE
jgi:phosphocarrier protein HPr